MADLVNAFATGYNIAQNKRATKAAEEQNAFVRGVTEKNLLRQSQVDARAIVGSLDTAFAKAAQWADTPEKWPAVQQYMGNAIQLATQQGLPMDLAQKFAAAVGQTSFQDRGPLAAQATLPQTKPVSALEEARRAVANGTATPDQRRMAGALAKEGVAPLVSIKPAPQFGPLSPGERMVEIKNPDGTTSYQIETIPGGKVDREAKAAEKKAAAQAATSLTYSSAVKDDIETLRKKIAEAPAWDPVLGLAGAAVSKAHYPGSRRVDAEELIQTIEAGIGFDRLQAMRVASPTGGSLGQVSDIEINLLKKALGSLSLAQSKDQVLSHIDRIEKIYSEVLRKARAYPNAAEFGFGPDTNAPVTLTLPTGQTATFPNASAAEAFKKAAGIQ